jgi:hypothetical protein
MENCISITSFKDMDNFKKLKNQAWEFINGRGDFSIDDFSPPEYKYFDLLLQLYGKLKDGKATKEEAKNQDDKNYADYEEYCNAYLDGVLSIIDSQNEVEKIKVIIAKQNKVEYQGTDYIVSAIIVRMHHKKMQWYYQVELHDLVSNNITIANIEKIKVKE